MSRSKVWIATISGALTVFAIIVVGTFVVTGEVKAWSIGLGGACFAAAVAIGNSILTARSKPDPPSPGQVSPAVPPGQQTGTTFATGGSIAGLAAGNDINIGMPPTHRSKAPNQPDEGA
ncbi:hypothetical protein ACGFIF_28960 [Kribbella sp. NPDC049174]|uniref:hypothetical protein n=1 Tax=Kribbella sp. NPDC049174 TaxID=3364112 RepID=UPI0037121923